MKKEKKSQVSDLEKILGIDESLEGKIQGMYAQKQEVWRDNEQLLARLKEQCQGIDKQIRDIGQKVGIVRVDIAQAELDQTADELAWFKEAISARKKALLEGEPWDSNASGKEDA